MNHSSAKQLQVHSLPFIVLALALTGVALVSVAGARGDNAALALLRPVIRVEPKANGLARVQRNNAQPELVEVSGVKGDNAGNISSAASLGGSVVLQQIVNQAFTKAKP